ncbi:C-C motif chemokine 6-like [Meriones unguiculatus]|uniref:C-C motif chemokine 6-like n=1 Tax=Meriones unguiculatus TaxID=10047 RepID=UPI000B4EE1E1|nr:C-C motif chemokine 6-like [Meriones unguiculatus]
MRNSMTAISFFILTAVLGSQAGFLHETIRKDHHFKPPVISQGFQDPSDCCYSYASRIRCSNFIYYFPTSGGCIKPGIIFVNRKRNQICANPSDSKVQQCISTLKQASRPGNKVIA